MQVYFFVYIQRVKWAYATCQMDAYGVASGTSNGAFGGAPTASGEHMHSASNAHNQRIAGAQMHTPNPRLTHKCAQPTRS